MQGVGGEEVDVVRQFNHRSRTVGTVIRVAVVCCPKGAFGPMGWVCGGGGRDASVQPMPAAVRACLQA
jgi:hypothetical protein